MQTNKLTTAAIIFSIGCFSWLGFKQIEPVVMPVIKEFTINVIEPMQDSVIISGTMNKVRSCQFLDVVAYSDNTFIGITFLNAPTRKKVNRLAGEQTYGPWELKPKTDTLRIYSTHRCFTGIVVTELFNGSLIRKV